jgi:ATP-binding cassette subfamily A (ABC1) protein 3
MAFLYPVSRLIKLLVEEKETRMKETLLILGVRPFAHWISWVITSAVVFFIIDVLVTVTLSSNVLKFSSPAYLFVYISLFSSASAGFSFFLAAFFSRAKLAAIVGPVALFATLLPRWIFFGTNRYEATAQKMWASLLPCTAFAFGADIIADYEYAEQGVQSYNASEGEYSFNTTLGFLFFDTLLYFTLAWYLELVLPRQYGVAEKWYFLFTPTYWLGSRRCCQSKQQHGYEMSSVVSNSDASSESADGER